MATAHTNLKPDEPAKSDYTLTASDNPIDESLHLGSHQQGRGRSGKHFIDSENNANIASSSFDINVARAVIHEKVYERVHEIRTKTIAKHRHEFHVIYRAQPVIDIQVRTPQHFLEVEPGKLTWIRPEDLPDGLNDRIMEEAELRYRKKIVDALIAKAGEK